MGKMATSKTQERGNLMAFLGQVNKVAILTVCRIAHVGDPIDALLAQQPHAALKPALRQREHAAAHQLVDQHDRLPVLP